MSLASGPLTARSVSYHVMQVFASFTNYDRSGATDRCSESYRTDADGAPLSMVCAPSARCVQPAGCPPRLPRAAALILRPCRLRQVRSYFTQWAANSSDPRLRINRNKEHLPMSARPAAVPESPFNSPYCHSWCPRTAIQLAVLPQRPPRNGCLRRLMLGGAAGVGAVQVRCSYRRHYLQLETSEGS